MSLTGQQPRPRAKSERGTALERRYFAWLHSYQTCCLSGRMDIDLAHTGGLIDGKGLGLKSPLRTVLPLSRPLHHVEESRRGDFWTCAGVPDYRAFAKRLFKIFKQGEPPHDLFADMQAKANRAYLAQILRKS